jgi:hypothetical protein
MDAATAGLIGALGGTALGGLLGYMNERVRTQRERRSRDIDRKRDVYARFLFAVQEMTRGAIPEGRWIELRDEVGRLEYELVLIAPTLFAQVKPLAHEVRTRAERDRAKGIYDFKGGEAFDEHWDPLIAAMRQDLTP